MSISFNFPRKKVPTVVKFPDLEELGSDEHLAWSYCGFYRNGTAAEQNQPHVLVSFRKREGDSWSSVLNYKRICVTGLGQVRIGSIWQNGRSREQLHFGKPQKFEVDFNPTKWKLRSFGKALNDKIPDPYPFSLYPHKHHNDWNSLLMFELPTGGRLVVPCLEFLARCYGGSGELRRVLTTYGWEEASRRLYAPLDEPEEDGKWKVKLTQRLVNRDVILLAHAKYEPYTQKIVKSIYSQLETSYEANKPYPIFVHVSPWFRGRAQLLVTGIPFDDGRSFLALNIHGASDPHGIDIQRDRENAANALAPADQPGGDAWANALKRRRITPPDIISMVGDDPDSTSETVEVEDPDFVVLGEERKIIDVRRDKANSSAGAKRDGEPAENYSGGEQHGANRGTGHVSVRTNFELESKGTLQDMWDALVQLHASYPEWLSKPESCDSRGVFSPVQQLIALTEIAEEKDFNNKIRYWVYLDRSPPPAIRGILVARVKILEQYVYILEVQRKIIVTTENGIQSEEEERLRGLVCKPGETESFEKWLAFMRTSIPEAAGIVKKLEGKIIQDSYAFRHPKSSKERISGEASLRNALRKVDILLPEQVADKKKPVADTTKE